MKLLTKRIRSKLLANGRASLVAAEKGEVFDPNPVVKLFAPWSNATWLLTELDPEAPEIGFGLCDLGMGCPELGSVSLIEMAEIRGLFGLTIERDRHFLADGPLSDYADIARGNRRICA